MKIFRRNTMKNTRRRKHIRFVGALALLLALLPVAANGSIKGYAAQSKRWEQTGTDIWKIKDSDGIGYVSDAWFLDLDGYWYRIGEDGVMFTGLITDSSTGKTYLMNTNHDGTYGRLITTDGTYKVNGQEISMQFNQQYDGTFGCITYGLTEARQTGGVEVTLSYVPTKSIESMDEMLSDVR